MGYKDPDVQRAYQAAWVKRRREEWLVENGPCVDCGSGEDLEVDHVDPSLKITHRVWSWSVERRSAELAKCVVRCGDCHKKKTALDLLPEHGTRTRYETHGCRCDECRAVKAIHNARRQYDVETKRTVWSV